MIWLFYTLYSGVYKNCVSVNVWGVVGVLDRRGSEGAGRARALSVWLVRKDLIHPCLTSLHYICICNLINNCLNCLNTKVTEIMVCNN